MPASSKSASFRSGNFNLETGINSIRPVTIDDDEIEMLLKGSICHMTRDIADILHISQMTAVRHLKTNEWRNRYHIWMPYNLIKITKYNKQFHLRFTAQIQRKWHPFLKIPISSNRKWKIYNNSEGKWSWRKRNESVCY